MPAGEPLRLAATRLRHQAGALIPALRPVIAASRPGEWRGRAGDDFRSTLALRARRLQHIAADLEATAARFGREADVSDGARPRPPAGGR